MKLLHLSTLCGMVALPIWASAADVEYDCHVVLSNNAAQIVFVEAPNRMRAEAVASRVRIKLGQGRTAGVKQVKQCVLSKSESLADPAAEAQRKTKPR
ncbi:hypothetical protein [Hydrogenophaga atypica]|uniref:Uncharacterized protein n=1 Tax=Hydrogenophaga atypica TaxID=249409 RepID=A0ABW2QIZ9_9BURK